MKYVQIRGFFWSVFSPNVDKYGLEKTLYLDTFHAMNRQLTSFKTNHLNKNMKKMNFVWRENIST